MIGDRLQDRSAGTPNGYLFRIQSWVNNCPQRVVQKNIVSKIFFLTWDFCNFDLKSL